MRYTMRLLVAAMLTVWVIPAAAQHMGGHGAGMEMPMQMNESSGMKCMMHEGMMQNMHGMMMGQMMNDPIMHGRMLTAILPTMKEPLSLSDEQAEELSKIKADYELRRSDLTDRIGEAKGRVQMILASESPDASQLKASLREAATLEADLKAAGFEAALSMKSRLSADQRAELEPMKMHQYMMANMTMMEMMQAMHGDMGSGMMMRRDGDDMMPNKMEMIKPGGMMKSESKPKKMEMRNQEGMVKPDENKQ